MSDLSLRFARARSVLGDYINDSYARYVDKYGIELFPTADAPSTYNMLCDAYEVAVSTGKFPVYNGGMQRTVYYGDSENLRFRFLHDMKHVEIGAEFTHNDEVRVAVEQMLDLTDYLDYYYGEDYAEIVGDTLRLFWIDTVCQSEYSRDNNGEFVPDQLEFAWTKFQQMTPVSV